MDKPLNGGWICEKHGIGYIGKCPTCASLENPPKVSKKNQKAIRQLLRKSKR
jgi:hypothetical protein